MANARSLDRPRLSLLADKLAIALCYLATIDDVIDPFADKQPDEAWDIVNLVNAANREILKGVATSSLFDGDRGLIIQGAKANTDVGIRETELYHDCLNAVRLMVRRVQ